MEKMTKYGTIEFDDKIFRKIINDAIKKADGKVYLHEKKGNLSISNEEKLLISFDVDINFGSSIKENTDMIFNYIEDIIKPAQLGKEVCIKLSVKGMKLKKGAIVDRDIVLLREF